MGSGEKKRTKTIRYKHCITGSKLCSLVSRYLYHSIQLRLSFFSFLLSFQQLSSSFERSSSSRILLSLSSLSVFLVFPLFSNPSHALRSSTFPPHAVFVLCGDVNTVYLFNTLFCTGGKTIQRIQEETGASIDINRNVQPCAVTISAGNNVRAIIYERREEPRSAAKSRRREEERKYEDGTVGVKKRRKCNHGCAAYF